MMMVIAVKYVTVGKAFHLTAVGLTLSTECAYLINSMNQYAPVAPLAKYKRMQQQNYIHTFYAPGTDPKVLGPIWLIWIIFNLCMDKDSPAQ